MQGTTNAILSARPPSASPKARKTRAAILTAAARLFAERGFAECTLREIAAVAQMRAGSMYYHFDSKDQILDEVLNTGIERLQEHVVEALASLGPDASVTERLREAVRAHVLSFLDVRGDANTFLRIYEYLPPIVKRRSRVARHRYASVWHALFEEGKAGGEIDPSIDLSIFVSYFLQGLNRIPEWFSPSRMTIDGICDVIFATTIKGLLREPSVTQAQMKRSAARKIAAAAS